MSSVLPLSAAALSSKEQSAVEARDNSVPETPAYFVWSGWLSRLSALVLLIPALPVIGLLVVITRLCSRGPGVYPQTRVGLQGKTFTVYKIRTMCQDAEARTGPVWAGVNDPRVTRLGHILRSLHLDELPQLYNVVKGDMTLVGPRPERPEFTQFLAREIPGYLGRLCVKPGITGLAQINLPPDSDVESVHKKLELDMEYIHAAGPSLDVRILCCTSLRLFGLKGLAAARMLGLRKKLKPRKARTRVAVDTTILAMKEAPGPLNGHCDAAAPGSGHAPHLTAEGRAAYGLTTERDMRSGNGVDRQRRVHSV